MIDKGKRSVLGTLVDVVDYESALVRILEAAKASEPLAAGFMSVHAVVTAHFDPGYRARLNRFELVCPDGQPVRWGLNWLHGAGLKDRVSGPDLSFQLYGAAEREGLSIYFYGTRPETLDLLGQRLHREYPKLKIAGAEPGLYREVSETERREIVDRIRASGADILYCGLGCPKQEIFAYENRSELRMPILCIGAALDFHAGVKSRAPEWMSSRGLEWVHRLASEPRRLAGRYLKMNPIYLSLLTLQKFGVKRFPAELPEPEPGTYIG